jgi:hypothetical protein
MVFLQYGAIIAKACGLDAATRLNCCLLVHTPLAANAKNLLSSARSTLRMVHKVM